MSVRTMRITPLATLVTAGLLGASLWLAAPIAIGRALTLWEAFVATAVILVLLEWWRGRRLRRARAQAENLRDSALW